ncbi:ATP-dependent helicase HrpB [Crocinitomix algicola]|uniref:ATP-dependent helicase HrpB n=1 Tax=Crocinitomix algicola TaxID=1740263 RepID=UPI0008726AA6|nr:ATP-dependent helicase HrpB [Crocinitomix algicola]
MKQYDPYQENLPIVEVFDSIKNTLIDENTTILAAPPGAGKSTLLPLALMNENWLKNQKILMLEPRRLAAKGIASRMSTLLDQPVGSTIGYRIRFESKTSERTKIEILTEGILTRILQQDSILENVGLVIFDEFHERSIHADVALTLVREIQKELRPDLRILIMSATIDTEYLSTKLKCPTIESMGRQFPISYYYEGDSDLEFLPESIANTVKKAVKEHQGDILCFLPGEREIKEAERILSGLTFNQSIDIQTLYGRLPQAKQQAAILPSKSGNRKIVLATSIAETSLTIQGIKIVIDSGYMRNSKYDPRSGLSMLTTERITLDAANQRAGRAGRLTNGICYRLWSKPTHSKLIPHRKPEILEADLTNLALSLYNWGSTDYQALTWIDEPPKHSMELSINLLSDLNAIESNIITKHGKAMAELPTHPRIAHMLLMAIEENLTPLATDLAALIEERDPLGSENGIDITLRIEALRRYRSNNKKGGRFGRIEKIASQYRKLMNVDPDNSAFDPYEAGLLLVHAYPERIAFARPGNNAQFQLSNGAYVKTSHKDDLAHEPWLAVANMHDNPGGTGRIFLAAPLNPKDLAPFVKEVKTFDWNIKKGGLKALNEIRIGSITLRSTPIKEFTEQDVINVLVPVLKKEGSHLLDFNEDVINWQHKIESLKIWRPELDLPKTSTDFLLDNIETWLLPYLVNMRKNADLKAINLLEALRYSVPFEIQELIDKLVPARITVPSGSQIKITYQPKGKPPILAVRLQEIFGLTETPKINEGRQEILMHILSPGYKIVQTTSDLKSFWQNAYHDVRKELRIKYKKHSWPENPFEQSPEKGVKRKK